MKKTKVFLVLAMIAVSMIFYTVPAQALIMEASAFTVAHNPPYSEEDIDSQVGNSGTITASANLSYGHFSNSSVTETGSLSVDGRLVHYDFQNFDVDKAISNANWSEMFVNNTGDNSTYIYNFQSINIEDACWWRGGVSDSAATAYLATEIFLNGSSVWLNFQTSDISSSNALNPFSGSINLGNYGNGETFELTVKMELGMWGSPLANHELGYDYFASGGLTGNVTSATALPTIPEPGTILLLGSGLVSMIGWCKKS